MRGALARFSLKRAQLLVDGLFDDFDFVDPSTGWTLSAPSNQLENDLHSPVFEISRKAFELA
jgi:hypothetical protein